MSVLLLPLFLMLSPVAAAQAWDSPGVALVVDAPAELPAPRTADFLRGYIETESPILVDVFAPAGTPWQLCVQRGSDWTLPGEVEWRLENQTGHLPPEEVRIASGSGSATVQIDLRVPLRWTVHTPGAYSLSVSFRVYEGEGADCQEGEL